VLTLVTGATDAVGFTRLGGVFTSVMTGNMVLLGVAAGRGEGTLALHTGVAFVCYVAGTLLGGRVAGSPGERNPLWPRPVTVALIIELAVYCAFTLGWEVSGAPPSGNTALGLLGVNAVALGIQSSAVLRFGVGGLSTTYLTGTLTTVVAKISSRDRSTPSGRSIAILVALVLGAALGAVLAVHAPRAAPFALVVPLGLVVVAAVTLFWHRDDAAG
jgi:uncharacterized membrane protein YoaK (UPF0700 family)